MPEHSAEFLRGAVAALERKPYDRLSVAYLLAQYKQLLAEAEAREAAPDAACIECDHQADGLTDAEGCGPLCKGCHAARTAPDAAAVIAECKVALKGVLALDPYCDHTNTRRGGAIWTICDDCGKQWADDKGGFQPDQPNEHIARVHHALAAVAEWEASHG